MAALIRKKPAPKTYLNTEDRWSAVLRRDPAADGSFYFAVKTTGVYCRPSCHSRRASRANVQFYSTQKQAQSAGYRPCKRCRPDEPDLTEQRAASVAKACRLIEQSVDQPSLDTLARAAGMSRFHFHRIFKSLTGLTPKSYAVAHHAGRVREKFSQAKTDVTSAIYSSGFNSNGRFYAAAAQLFGMRPKTYSTRGAGETIRFAIGQCSLGTLLVAATAKGVCAIFLGNDPNKLVRDLQNRFSNATLISGGKEFGQRVAKVIAFVESPALGLQLPLDIRGTAFQQRVWQTLSKIPSGTTATYKQIAQRIGAPQSVRAVAQACAANPVAIAIPCHRVVRTDGALAGYRWGIARKRKLLNREAN